MIKKFLPVILLNFVNILGYSLLIPVYPKLVGNFVSEQWLGIVYGGLMSTYAICQFLAAPILGSLSDRYGRKPLLLISQLGTTLSWVIFGLSYLFRDVYLNGWSAALMIIAFSRVTDGLTGGNISVANAWVSDMTGKEEKNKAFGLMGATFGVGFLFGPVLGGFSSTGSMGYLGTVILAFLISLLTLVIIYFYLPESLAEDKRDKELDWDWLNEINILNKFKLFSKNRFINYLFLNRLFLSIVFASFNTVIVLFWDKYLNISPLETGLALSVVGIFSIFN